MEILPVDIRQRIYRIATLEELRGSTRHRKLWRDVMNQLRHATYYLRLAWMVEGTPTRYEVNWMAYRTHSRWAYPDQIYKMSCRPLEKYRHYAEWEALVNAEVMSARRKMWVSSNIDIWEDDHGLYLHTAVY